MTPAEYRVAFKYKKDYLSNPLIDIEGHTWCVWTAPKFCCPVGVHTNYQAEVIKEHGGIPVPIGKLDKTWNIYFKRLVGNRTSPTLKEVRDAVNLPEITAEFTSVFMRFPSSEIVKIIRRMKPVYNPTWLKPSQCVWIA